MVDQPRAKAARYCRNRAQLPNFEARLGSGQDGVVWTVADKSSAIKVFDQKQAFNREDACYLILAEGRINKIREFNIPEMLDHDDDLLVIQMTMPVTICGGIVRKLSTASDRLLRVGPLINHQKYDLATNTLNAISQEELGPAYNLKAAVLAALEKRELFRP